MKFWNEIKEAYQGPAGVVLVPLTLMFASGIAIMVIAVVFGYWPTGPYR
jgi:hypothetical protein